eukprot:TRINITY_DN2909_c0_g1_i2.p1 TRINITY_DN2909_c0_g1~~TRINITY_DN2909_c0_g1_i2.p1  ORF type:complete len:418 (-),score=6.37 TRINITY_DN2909_c0_g1_i2:538-1791(-)
MTIHIPSDHSPLIQIKIDNLNKFHVLKVKLKRTTCPEEKQLADSPPPVMLQYTQGMNEERYFTFGQKDNFRLRWHEITHASNSTISNVTLAFFSNPECSHEIEISMDVVASVGHLTRSFIMIFIAPVFSWSLIVFVIQSYNFHKKGVFPPAGEVQFKLLANSAGPVIVICSSISFLAIYYGYDQYFSDLIPYFVSLVNLTEHSFVNMVKPWPSVTVLFVANLLSMGILLLWVGVCSLLLYPARCLSKDKVEGNEKVIEKSGISRILISFISFCLLVIISVHQTALLNIHECIPMIISIVVFILKPRRYASENQINYDHSLLVIYSMILLLTIPDFVIFIKDTTYSALPFSYTGFMAICMVLHLYLSEYMLQTSRTQLDLVACVLLAIGIQLFCLYPIYRINNLMCFFFLFNISTLLR